MGALTGRQWLGIGALAVGVVVLVLIIFASVRDAGQQALNLFRVQDTQTIQLTQEFLDSLPEPDEDLIEWQEEPFDEDDEPREVTLAEAEEALGFTLAKLAEAPDYVEAEPQVMVSEAGEATFTINLPAARNYVWALGGDGAIFPDNLEGAVFRVTMPVVGVLAYTAKDNPEQAVRLMQTTSPTLSAPEGVDMDAIRAGLLELAILPPDLAAQLEAIDDWESTLVLPIVEGMSQEVQIGSATGIQLADEDEDQRMLVWVADDRIYVLSTDIPGIDLVALAQDVR